MSELTLDRIGTRFDGKREDGDEFHVEFPPENEILLIVPLQHDSAAANFDHPNILAKTSSILEFKHYHPKRGKWWTSKPGLEVAIIIPKNKIELIPECGYSYPEIRVAGEVIRLNVSGGTTNGWTDWVRQGSHTSVYRSVKQLKAMCSVAMSPEEVRDKEIPFYGFKMPDEPYVVGMPRYRGEEYAALVAEETVKLKAGMKVVLKGGYKWEGSNGPFFVYAKLPRKQKMTVTSLPPGTENVSNYNLCRISRKNIDWAKTAEANDIALAEWVNWTRVAVPAGTV